MWYNSKQSGSVGQTRKLDLSNIKLSGGDQSYKAEYWCFAKNSDGPGRSQNVTVSLISQGKTTSHNSIYLPPNTRLLHIMKWINNISHSNNICCTIVLSKTRLHHTLTVSFSLLFFLDFNKFCFEDNDSGYTWEKTPVGTSVIKKCLDGKIGTVWRSQIIPENWIL